MYWNGIFQRKRALQGIIFHFPEEARHSIARAHVHSTNWTHCTLYTAHCTLYNAHCTLYTAQWTLNTVHFSLYTVHFSLYTVHWTTGHYTYNNAHFHFFSVFPESASDAQLTCLWRQTTRVLFFVFVFFGFSHLMKLWRFCRNRQLIIYINRLQKVNNGPNQMFRNCLQIIYTISWV